MQKVMEISMALVTAAQNGTGFACGEAMIRNGIAL
jgi:hypothetical protein